MAAGPQYCNFERKTYKTVFTCYICMVDSHDTERYRCNHCDRSCHTSCFEPNETIELGPGPDNIFSKGGKGTKLNFKLFAKPQTGEGSNNGDWAKYCVVCGMLIKHYSYYCQVKSSRKDLKDLNMHPCCAELAKSGSPFPDRLKLITKVKSECVWCTRERPEGASLHGPDDFFCWSYKLTKNDNRTIHVHCYSEMVIQALKSIVPSDQNDDNIRIVLRSTSHPEFDWNTLVEAMKTALSLTGLDPAGILQNLIN